MIFLNKTLYFVAYYVYFCEIFEPDLLGSQTTLFSQSVVFLYKINYKNFIIMEQQLLNLQIPKEKIYKDKALWVGTFIGGPLVAGYFIAENFKAFNDTQKANRTWMIAILATIIIMGGALLIPDDTKIPAQMIPIVYTSIAYGIGLHFQKKLMDAHTQAGGVVFGWGRILGISVIGLIVTLAPIIGYAVIMDIFAE